MACEYCIVRYRGKIYRVPKGAFETEERAQDRAWYVAKKLHGWSSQKPDELEYELILNEAHMYANKKYLGMEY